MHAGILGLILSILLTTMAVIMHGSFGWFNVPSLTITLGIGSGLTILSYGINDFGQALKSMQLLFSKTLTTPILKRSATVLRGMIRYIYISGALGSLISLMAMLMHISDPLSLGSGIFISLLTFLYAIIISEFFLRPTACRIEGEIEKKTDNQSMDPTW